MKTHFTLRNISAKGELWLSAHDVKNLLQLLASASYDERDRKTLEDADAQIDLNGE